VTVVVRGVVLLVVGWCFAGAGFEVAGERALPAVGGSEEIPMSVLTARVARNAIAAATSNPSRARRGQRREDTVTPHPRSRP
jgi:hypothetical protein